jgi:hypothetical protein
VILSKASKKRLTRKCKVEIYDNRYSKEQIANEEQSATEDNAAQTDLSELKGDARTNGKSILWLMLKKVVATERNR